MGPIHPFTARLRILPLLILPLLHSTLPAQDKQLFGRISFPLGIVQLKASPSPDWVRAILNQEVFVGDRLRTMQKSRCEITLSGGGRVRIAENSELELTAASVSPLKKEFGATITSGQVWVAAKAAFGETKNVAIRAPTAVAAIRGTKYRTIADTAESSVLVYDGNVDVIWSGAPQDGEQGDEGGTAPGPIRIGPPQEVAPPEEVPGPYEVSLEDWITLVEGMRINVRSDGRYNLFEFDQAVDAQLEFVRWNKDLDTQQGQ